MDQQVYERVEKALDSLLARAGQNPLMKVTVSALSKESGVSRTTLHKPEYAPLLRKLKTPTETPILDNDAEILRLRKQLSTKDEELAKLKQQLSTAKKDLKKLQDIAFVAKFYTPKV